MLKTFYWDVPFIALNSTDHNRFSSIAIIQLNAGTASSKTSCPSSVLTNNTTAAGFIEKKWELQLFHLRIGECPWKSHRQPG